MSVETPAPTKPRFTFLRDVPATDDAFGSHKRIADAVANAIVDNKDIHVVGVVGPWGSGKSTVVGFIEKAVKTQRRTYVFTYDAWLHQSDPPRRAFLEELIYFLRREKLAAPDDWQDDLDRLAGRLEDTTTTRTPVLTLSGRLVLISALFSPVGFGLIMKSSIIQALTNGAGPKNIWNAPPGFWLGIFLLSLPVLASIAVYLCWRPTWRFWTSEFWSTHRGKHAKESIFSLVMNRKIETERSRVIKDPTPTAIEFQKNFRRILDDVTDLRYDFLFIVDNLDRLPAIEALEMWSTIRSLFLGVSKGEAAGQAARLPTVILPIDEDAIARIYSNDDPDNQGHALAKAFIDKTFDLTFRLTRPVYTGWRAFLEVQIKEVFGKDVDTHWIARAGEFLDYQSLETSTPITPRRINNFVNDLAITWTQWYDFNVSFFSVCYYCVFREQLNKEIEAPARMIGLPKASIDLHDPDWQRAVAAMHYGVDPSVAFQVLLTGPLRQAIEQWKPKDFRSLMKQQGFTEVLRKLAQGYRDVASTIPKVVVQTINILDAEEPEGTTEFSDIWRMLHDALPKTATWDAFESDALDAIRALLKRGTPQQNGSLLLSIQNCINGIQKERASDTALMTAKLWHQVAGDFDASLDYVTEIRLPGESETFVHVASVCRDDPNVISKLKTSANSASVVETLIEDLKGRVDRNEDERLRGVFNAGFIDDWTKYLNACNADPLSGLNQATKTALLGFCLLSQQKGWRTYFESLVPRLVALVPLALTAKDFDVAGRACALLATVQPTSFPAITAKPSDDDASKFVRAFDAATKDLSGEPMTCKTALDVIRDHASTETLLGEVLTYRLRNGGGSDLTPSLYFSHFDVIQRSLAADVLPGLLQQLTTTDAFWSEFATLQLSDNWLRTFGQLSVANPRDDRLASLLKEKLAQASEADWAAAISGGDDLCECSGTP
jgi:hypothetical protein